MGSQVDLNVALGLEDPPLHFNYGDFESNFVDEPESNEVRLPEGVVELDSDVVGEPDCVIVGIFEKGITDKASCSNVEKEAEHGEDNIVLNTKDAPLTDRKIVVEIDVDNIVDCTADVPKKADSDVHEHVPVKVPEKQDPDVEEHVPLKVPKKEDADVDKNVDDKDDEKQKKPETVACDRRTAALIAFELEEKLKVGKFFPDLEKVYLLFCQYARFKGFSVRKGKQRYFGKSRYIRWKEFICSCTGLPNYRSAKHKIDVYKKVVTRTDCKARLIVSRDDLGSYIVCSFDKDHNHELLDCDQTFMLRSSRHMSYAKKSVLEALNSAGIGVTAAFNFMAKESGGEQNVGFTKKDAYHHMDRVRMQTMVEDGDARLLLDYFSKKSTADLFFFCRYQLDDDGRLMDIFFRDRRSVVDYDAFGDVLSVDTTYRTNKYNMICAPFVGINHHTRNVMFGMAMLSDESTATFKWLFETFLQSMDGKQPIVIFTDQCRAMMNAIDVIFPNSKHRLCQWHIMKNCISNFGKLQGDNSFKSLWYRCMNIVETEEDFETTWNEMMENYDIANRSWYDGMYNIRHRWASCFSRGIFTADLLATSRSELTNKVLKDVVRCTVALSTFVKEYEDILQTWRSTERKEDTIGIWKPGQAVHNNGLLDKAASVYTSTIYKQFEHDLANCINIIVDSKAAVLLPNNNIQYIAKDTEFSSFERTVVLNSVTGFATCDCGKWETEGLICRHILYVLVIENVYDIHDSMIYRRWTKRAKDVNFLAQENVVEESSIMRHMTFGNEFMRHMSETVSSAMEHESLRLILVQRMKEVSEEFSDLVRNYVASKAEVKLTPPLVAPIFRDQRKICPRGFANVRKSNPYPSKGRKRAPKSSPKSTAGKSFCTGLLFIGFYMEFYIFRQKKKSESNITIENPRIYAN